MRAIEGELRPTRSLTSVWIDAVVLVRQDIGEYGFIAAIGGVAAAITAAALRLAGGDLVIAAIVPAVLICAIFTYATAAAAVARAEDQLEPDAALAFVATAVRAPWILVPMVPALLLSYGAVFAGLFAGRWIPAIAASAVSVALLAFVATMLFQRSLFVPALFARNASVQEAWKGSTNILRAISGAVAITWLVVTAPVLVLALVGLAAGYGILTTTLASFALAACMPVAAAAMTLLCEHAAYAAAPQEPAPRRDTRRTAAATATDRVRRRAG